MRRVAVIGAGMTGLACAWALKGEAEVTVFEASDRVGGNIRTVREGGFVMDAGPDAWLASKPEASALAREANAGELIGTRPENRRVYVAWRGRLHPMPEGVVLGVPTRIAPMVTTRLFSLQGKARMALEPFVPRRESTEDESVADFVARRLGREAVDRLAGPLLGGIFAGDVHRISLRAAFPQLAEQEAQYGSLVFAMRAQARKRKGGGSAFVTLRQGMAAFPETLARTLDVKLGASVTRITHADGRFRVDGTTYDVVVVATGPDTAAALLDGIDAEAAVTLRGIRCGSSAAVFLGYRRADVAHPLDATGFVVGRDEGMSLTAATFVTSKWEDRGPEGHVLLRAFLGGAGRESVLERTDDELALLARRELGALLGHLGEPVLVRVERHHRASPQPDVGHTERMQRLAARLAASPGLFVIGNGYGGTGIPDCIKQARATAEAIRRLPTT